MNFCVVVVETKSWVTVRVLSICLLSLHSTVCLTIDWLQDQVTGNTGPDQQRLPGGQLTKIQASSCPIFIGNLSLPVLFPRLQRFAVYRDSYQKTKNQPIHRSLFISSLLTSLRLITTLVLLTNTKNQPTHRSLFIRNLFTGLSLITGLLLQHSPTINQPTGHSSSAACSLA